MPKRTKKEKIIAEYRRKLTGMSSHSEAIHSIEEPTKVRVSLPATPTFSLSSITPHKEHHEAIALDPKEFLAIKKDLVSTLIITACILIGEIIIWRIGG